MTRVGPVREQAPAEPPSTQRARAWLPPRWFIRLAWITQRNLVRWTGGRIGLWRPKPGGWGTARLTTTGRKTGQPRSVLIGYFVDGSNFVTLAMNGWDDPEPAWWLNLKANPDAELDTVDGSHHITGREATGDERERLWAQWQRINRNLDAYAGRRSRQTAVVVLDPGPKREVPRTADRSRRV